MLSQNRGTVSTLAPLETSVEQEDVLMQSSKTESFGPCPEEPMCVNGKQESLG